MRQIVTGLLLALGVAPAAQADYVLSCTGKNTALHFVLYEDTSGFRGGHMYLMGMQIAGLAARRLDNRWLVATVNGNTASTELQFDTLDGQVFVSIHGSNQHVCQARISR